MYNKRKAIFNKIVNPLLLKHLTADPNDRCFAANIPIKYLKYFKEVTAHKNAMKVRYRYRGVSKTMPDGYVYNRPQSFCHMNFADTFALYHR